MKKTVLNEEFKRMQELASITNENDNKMSKSVKLSDLEWDFSEGNEIELKIGNEILVISRYELDDFIESWDENLMELK